MPKKLSELYAPKPKGEKAFVKKHTDASPAPMKNAEPTKDDKLFNATNIKTYNRKANRQGYNPGEDEVAYGVGGDVGVNDEPDEVGISPYTVKEEEDKPRLRLIKTHTLGPHTAKVYKDLDWSEHRVKYFKNGVHQTKADYHTDDVKDAHDTAIAGLKHYMKEHLASDASASDYIHDFVHSKNSKFAGESKKERIKRALGAYYGKHESEDEISDDDVIETLFDILDDMLGEQITETSGRDFARGVNPNHPATTIKNPEKHPHYSAVAVQKEIDRHNRRPRGGKISKREAEMIHRLLRGRD